MESSSLSSVASGESRASVVLPAPEGPEKRYARPFRMRLAACTTSPCASRSASEYRIRRKLSIEYSLASPNVTLARRSARSTIPAKSQRLTTNRARSPSRETRTSPSDRWPSASRRSISIRQSGVPGDRKPLYRSRTTSRTSRSRVTTAARRPAISMLSSSMQRSPHHAPQSQRERKEPWNQGGHTEDRAITPARSVAVEPGDAAATLDGHDLAQDLHPIDDLGGRQRVAFGHESIAVTADHPVQEEPARRFVAHDVTDGDSCRRGGHHLRDIAIPDEGQHTGAPGPDP